MYSFFHTNSGLAPVFLRLILVAIFLFHGGQKCFGWFGGEGWLKTLQIMTGSSGLGLSSALAAAVIVLEIALVPLLFLGFLTRLAALIGCVLMVGALYYVHGGSSFVELQVPLLVLASCLALLFSGAGAMSLDRKISSALLPPLRPGGLRLT